MEMMREIEIRKAERAERSFALQERKLEEMRLERESRKNIEMERIRLERDRIKIELEERKENRKVMNLVLKLLAKKQGENL